MGHTFPTQKLFDDYNLYKETSLSSRRFKHSDIIPLINKLEREKGFIIKKVGESIEGRAIYLISIGNGDTDILSWSQMHGDEATATMAIFDLFNFFSSNDKYNEFKNMLLEKVTLHFIPMLNPDGAERFQRQNALGIDLNRDAVHLTSPESKILMSVHNDIKPQFGFNLHDQNSNYRVGYDGKTAAISFVAPPFDFDKSMSKTRENSMKVIIDIYNELTKFIPGNMARYSDEYEPRSFGDNFTNSNTSSILIESGGWKEDSEKQFLRQLNFVALLAGFSSISDKQFDKNDAKDYFLIKENKELMFDILLRNVGLPFKDDTYSVDIGINHEEKNTKDCTDYYKVGVIKDIGDLSTYSSNNEIDCTGLTINYGETFQQPFETMEEIAKLNFEELFQANYLSVVLKDISIKDNFTKLPINILLGDRDLDYNIIVENNANFVIKNREETKLIVLNGFVFEPTSEKILILNGLIIT